LLSNIRPLDDNKVVISVYRGKELEGNLKFIYEEILKLNKNSKIHLIFSENKMNLKLFKDIFFISNAKYLILDDFYLPVYLIKPKKTLKVIQLWHAAGAFKKFGYSTIDYTFGPDREYLQLVPIHSNYTHVYVSSENIVHHYAEAFDMDQRNIYPLGIPRSDMFFDEVYIEKTIKKIQKEYGRKIAKKTIILFAPTYRASNSQRESSIDFVDILHEISLNITEDKVVVYKPHPYLMNLSLSRMREYRNIIVADKYSINEWMLISDAFITDYSSAVFEYGILHRPIAHYVPDLNEYENNRGLYYPIEKISDGEIIFDIEDLIQWISKRMKNEYWDTKNMLEFNFGKLGNVSKRIARHFLDNE